MKQASNLFLFAPSKNWTYCGGATLICADTPEEAIAIGNAAIEHDKNNWNLKMYNAHHVIAEHAPFSVEEGKEYDINDERWVLVNKFILAEPLNVGVVFSDANDS